MATPRMVDVARKLHARALRAYLASRKLLAVPLNRKNLKRRGRKRRMSKAGLAELEAISHAKRGRFESDAKFGFRLLELRFNARKEQLALESKRQRKRPVRARRNNHGKGSSDEADSRQGGTYTPRVRAGARNKGDMVNGMAERPG